MKTAFFRPIEAVELPEHCEVQFEPQIIEPAKDTDNALNAVYEVLGRRFNSGVFDTAARHNEHQP